MELFTAHIGYIPLFSIVSLATEILVTISVLSIIYRAYHSGVFMRWLAYGTLLYEGAVNISYMTDRLIEHIPDQVTVYHEASIKAFAAFHGIFSLVMFIALVVFLLFAANRYKKGENYFRTHRILTRTFVVAWLISIFSGITFFLLLYVV